MLLPIPVPLLQRVTSGRRPRSNQEGLPLASGSTSSGSLAPSLFQGHAAKGHPWPIAALSASMPLNPLHNDSTRPPDGAFGVVCEIGDLAPNRARALRLGRNALALSSAFHITLKHRGPQIPSGGRNVAKRSNSRRPARRASAASSGGAGRGAFGMDAKRGIMGQGWPFATILGTVPERGELSAAKPVCRARFLFGYFLFREQRESDSP